MKIAINQIIPDPNQPRKTFKEETLQELKDSYSKLGLIQPITVRPCNGKYQIVIGERRYKASLLNGQKEIECVVREDIDNRTAREMQFAENSQQEDISPLELGKAFTEHRQQYSLTQRELADIIGLSKDTINHYEALCIAAIQVQSYIQSGKLDASTAYEIGTIKDEKRQSEFADLVAQKGLARSEVRQLKPIVESQKHRPVESIYISYRQQQESQYEKKISIPEVSDLIERSKLPVRILELLTTWENTTILTRSVSIDTLDMLAQSQRQQLSNVGQNLIKAIQDKLTTNLQIAGGN